MFRWLRHEALVAPVVDGNKVHVNHRVRRKPGQRRRVVEPDASAQHPVNVEVAIERDGRLAGLVSHHPVNSAIDADVISQGGPRNIAARRPGRRQVQRLHAPRVVGVGLVRRQQAGLRQ